MVAVAIGGAAVLGAGASIVSGNKAAKAQEKGADQAAATQKYMYDTTRNDYAPWREAGNTALNALMSLYGLPANGSTTAAGTQGLPNNETQEPADSGGGGFFEGVIVQGWRQRIASGQATIDDAPAFVRAKLGAPQTTPTPATGTGAPAGPATPYGGLQTSPGYEFRRDEGIKAIERSQLARGLGRSGATVKAIDRYADGLAASEYDNYASRLAQLAGFGQSATAGTAAAGSNYANGAAAAYTNAGNARASGYANVGSSINSGLNGVMSAYLMGGGTNMFPGGM